MTHIELPQGWIVNPNYQTATHVVDLKIPQKQSSNYLRCKRWQDANPERKKEIANAWYQKNKEKVNQQRQEKRKQDPERYRKDARDRYRENAERYCEAERQRRKENPEKGREYARQYRKNNPEKYKEAQRKQRQKFNAKTAEYKLAHGCIDCGYKGNAVALHFDHVNGDKVKEVCKFTTWDAALKEIAKCVVRCANCHAIKTYENKQFRGWRKKLENTNGKI